MGGGVNVAVCVAVGGGGTVLVGVAALVAVGAGGATLWCSPQPLTTMHPTAIQATTTTFLVGLIYPPRTPPLVCDHSALAATGSPLFSTVVLLVTVGLKMVRAPDDGKRKRCERLRAGPDNAAAAPPTSMLARRDCSPRATGATRGRSRT